jgi:hypothetical protein
MQQQHLSGARDSHIALPALYYHLMAKSIASRQCAWLCIGHYRKYDMPG